MSKKSGLIKTTQAAEKFDVKPATIRNWYKRGLLPAIKIGKTIRFKEEDVEKLLQPSTCPA